jgi:uncharacterized protein (DUF488 family)
MIFTIGHSTRSVDELIALLREAGVDFLVDVRTVPRSRFNPQFNAGAMPAPLAEVGIGYRHMAVLGGLRHRPKGAGPSPNGGWRNEAFQAYADYALTAVMCAEAVWWRCHRRIIADYLLVGGVEVRHIMDHGKTEPATLTPAAEPQADGSILYPAAQGELL